MKQLSKRGLLFFVIGIALYLVFRNSIGMIAGLVFIVAGVVFVIQDRNKLNKNK